MQLINDKNHLPCSFVDYHPLPRIIHETYHQTALVNAAGSPPKTIEEFFGNVNSRDVAISIARMKSPQGWREPGQTPQFDEYTVVLKGTLVVETETGKVEVHEKQAIHIAKHEWVRYGTPYENGAEYIAVCLPAFSPGLVQRGADRRSFL